ncbi:hypothetical protein K3495_g12573 [Podosphaera aphanis]|nr:hypothetical protein K3495_g12573 [Podosphaera aphanis]
MSILIDRPCHSTVHFESTIKGVLQVACVWSIVTGAEHKPVKEEGNSVSDADIGNWIARNEKAMSIIVGSIDPIHRSDDLDAALSTQSVANLWKQATKLNGSPVRSLNTSI